MRHLLFLIAFFGLWEWSSRAGWLDRTLFGQPSAIALYLWRGFFVQGHLWLELGYTLAGTLMSFVLGSMAAIVLGLGFTQWLASAACRRISSRSAARWAPRPCSCSTR